MCSFFFLSRTIIEHRGESVFRFELEKMNATNRLDVLLNEPSTLNNRINQGTSIQPLSCLTFSEHDAYPSSILPPVIATTVPLPPRRDSSSMKHHRRRHHQIDHETDKQKTASTSAKFFHIG